MDKAGEPENKIKIFTRTAADIQSVRFIRIHKIEGWNSQTVKNPTLVNHTAVEKATTNLCMFQMARLEDSMST